MHHQDQDHTIPKVPPTDIFVVIGFSKLGKHTHMLNKIVGTKIPKNQCKKMSSLEGGREVVPTPKI